MIEVKATVTAKSGREVEFTPPKNHLEAIERLYAFMKYAFPELKIQKMSIEVGEENESKV